MTTVSIITASKNNARALADCLHSIQEQTFEAWEHIVIDGGSTDGTIEILNRFTEERRCWVSETDSGIAEAMNKGIARARGEWLLFLHADDRLKTSSALAEVVPHLSEGHQIISANVKFRRPEGSEITVRARGWTIWTHFKTTVPHQGALIKKVAFADIGLYDPSFHICMDYDWFLRAFLRDLPLKKVPITLSVMSASGVSSRRDWKSLKRRFAEEKRVHFKNAQSMTWRSAYSFYWAIYPLYRRLRHAGSRLISRP